MIVLVCIGAVAAIGVLIGLLWIDFREAFAAAQHDLLLDELWDDGDPS